MADKAKQIGLVIAIIAGITLPTLAIAWAGGGRLARVEVKAENNGINHLSHVQDDKEFQSEARVKFANIEKENAEAKLRDVRIESQYSEIVTYMKMEASKTDEILKEQKAGNADRQEIKIELTKVKSSVDNLENAE